MRMFSGVSPLFYSSIFSVTSVFGCFFCVSVFAWYMCMISGRLGVFNEMKKINLFGCLQISFQSFSIQISVKLICSKQLKISRVGLNLNSIGKMPSHNSFSWYGSRKRRCLYQTRHFQIWALFCTPVFLQVMRQDTQNNVFPYSVLVHWIQNRYTNFQMHVLI